VAIAVGLAVKAFLQLDTVVGISIIVLGNRGPTAEGGARLTTDIGAWRPGGGPGRQAVSQMFPSAR
jgi:hypothetical protein